MISNKSLYIFNFLLILFSSVLLFNLYTSIFLPTEKKVISTPTPAPTPIPTPVPTPTPIPLQISIPEINVQTDILEVGVVEGTNQMDVPKDGSLVGWYKELATPGATGSAILAAHYDMPGGAAGVFYNLKKLQPGSKINIIDSYNQQLEYETIEIINEEIANFPLEKIYDENAPSHIVLLTCSGYWIPSLQLYSNRLAVIAKLKNKTKISQEDLIAINQEAPETFFLQSNRQVLNPSQANLQSPYIRLDKNSNQIEIFLTTSNQDAYAFDTTISFDPTKITVNQDDIILYNNFEVKNINFENGLIRLSAFSDPQRTQDNLLNTGSQEIKIATISYIDNSPSYEKYISLVNPQILKLPLNEDISKGENILKSSQNLTLK